MRVIYVRVFHPRTMTVPRARDLRGWFVSDDERESDLVGELQRLCAKDEQEAVKRLLVAFESLLSDGAVARVNDILDRLDPARIGPSVTLAALAITWPASKVLQSRPRFLCRAEETLQRTLGTTRAGALLSGRR
jgi:hypothetical protein